MTKLKVAILGGGLAGISAAYRLSQIGSFDLTVYEKNDSLGGHTRSHSKDGFIFDEGPHISFTKNEQIRNFLAEIVKGEFYEKEAKILNYWRGHWIKHPVQSNLFGLPADIIEKCLESYRQRPDTCKEPVTYQQWCLKNYGSEFYDNFIYPYTKKYWTCDPAIMSCDWIAARMHVPTLEEIQNGASSPNSVNKHYITRFRYPKDGGFQSYLNFAPKDCRYLLNTDIHRIRLPDKPGQKWRIYSSDIDCQEYDRVISTLPLPVLFDRFESVPEQIQQAVSKLFCTSIVLINLGFRNNLKLPEADWFYCYDSELIFSRVHFPHRLSPQTCPTGCQSLQAEIYHSKYKSLPEVDLVELTVKQLVSMGILDSSTQIIHKSSLSIPFGNVVFDANRQHSIEAINLFLDKSGLLRAGRYAEWAYYWTDDTILSAWKAAEEILSS